MWPLYKVSSQSCHFVLGFLWVESSSRSPAFAPSPPLPLPLSPTVHGVPHGRVFQLHQILKHGVTEHTARMLGLITRQGRFGFVKIHVHQRRLAQLARLGRHPHLVGVLEEVHDHVAFVAGHLPLGARRGVQHQNPVLTLHALPNAKHAEGMLARGVGALIAAHTWGRSVKPHHPLSHCSHYPQYPVWMKWDTEARDTSVYWKFSKSLKNGTAPKAATCLFTVSE